MLDTCEDGQGNQGWFYETMTNATTEPTFTGAFIGGYYGPDPMVIDVYGHVKWRADSQAAIGCITWN